MAKQIKQQNCVESILNERICPWNWALYTRAEVVREMTLKGFGSKCIDFWAFQGSALSDAQIASMFECGELMNDVPNVFPQWFEEARWTD